MKRISEKHRIRTLFKPTTKLRRVLSSGKDMVQASKRRGAVCEFPCWECEQIYIGETKRSLTTELTEHHEDILPKNILFHKNSF